MTIREAIRAQREEAKNKSPRERLAYFWEYYGTRTIIICLCAALVIFLAVDVLTQKEAGLIGVFFGAAEIGSQSDFMGAFMEYAGIDSQTHDAAVQLSLDIRLDGEITEETYQTMQGFSTMVATKSVDNVAADADLLLYYSYLHYFTDLRTVFSSAELERLEPWLNYIDGQLLRQHDQAEEGTALDYRNFPDPKDPAAMADPIPVAIDLSMATESFHETYRFTSEKVLIGICATTERPDAAAAFLRFLFEL